MSSLMVSALYEKKFKKKLISNIIYPQNKAGDPVYNPCGKYMIKLHINGVRRKVCLLHFTSFLANISPLTHPFLQVMSSLPRVILPNHQTIFNCLQVIIDDYFPIDDHGSLLCSYSSKSDEFWVSLLEKSYMKVMGGYDFPGSNSVCYKHFLTSLFSLYSFLLSSSLVLISIQSIDLHALTGWIPERMSTRDETFNGEKVFSSLIDRHRKGDVLITAATGELSDVACDRTGLVSTHAYAVLDLRSVEVSNSPLSSFRSNHYFLNVSSLLSYFLISIATGKKVIVTQKSLVTYSMEGKLFGT